MNRARLTVLLFVTPYLLLGLVWAVANPAGAAPDEADHTVKALGLSHFDIGVATPPQAHADDPTVVRNTSISRDVVIPARLDPTDLRCFRGTEDTAGCQVDIAPGTPGDATVTTVLGSYPPFLYPPIGWAASLGATAESAVVLGRLVVLGFSMVLLWLSCSHLVRWLGAPSLLGIALVLTPMVVFFTGILGTSALEILAAVGVSAVVAVYARRPESLRDPRALATFTFCGSVLVLSRQLGVVTLAALVMLLLALGGWRPVLAGLRERQAAMWTAVLVPLGASACLAMWELAYDHPARLGPWLTFDSLRSFFLEALGPAVQGMVGRFGWLEVVPPFPANPVWLGVVLVAVVTAFTIGDRRDRTVLAIMTAAGLMVGVVVYSRIFFNSGFPIQGRHLLPFLAVVPVWTGVVLAERLTPRVRVVAVRIAAVALPTIVAVGLYVNFKRYAVGLGPTGGPSWFVPVAQWEPPGGWYPWLLLTVAAVVLLGVSWVRVLGAGPGSVQGRLRGGPVRSPIPRT